MNRVCAFLMLVVCAMVVGGCSSASPRRVLDDYYEFGDSDRKNDPADYISFLKSQRFRHGELDHLPRYAIILYADPASTLKSCGISALPEPLRIGSATPELLYVLKTRGGTPFMLIQGQAGAGGVTTIGSELIALGATHVVHIGTCAALGNDINSDTAIVSAGSYKDGAAVLLSNGGADAAERIARPDDVLARQLTASLTVRKIRSRSAIGFTTPIYYFEPTGLYRHLLDSRYYSPPPAYLEMEQAPFFMTARRMKAKAASVVVADDRYFVNGNQLQHEWLKDATPTLQAAVAATLDAFEAIDAAQKSATSSP